MGDPMLPVGASALDEHRWAVGTARTATLYRARCMLACMWEHNGFETEDAAMEAVEIHLNDDHSQDELAGFLLEDRYGWSQSYTGVVLGG